MNSFNIKSTSFTSFVSALEAKGYISVDYNALLSTYQTLMQMKSSKQKEDAVATIILDGPPGVGKSYMAKTLALLLDATFLQYNCHPDSSHEEIVRDINIIVPVVAQSGFADKKYTKEDIYIYGQLYDAVRLSAQGPVVLLIDEIDKARTAIDALLLGFLNDGYLSVQGLSGNNGVERLFCNLNNIIVVITKNDERDLHPALLRRGRVVYMDYPTPEIEKQMLIQSANIGSEAAMSLVTQANKLRANGSITKPPSSPELVRLAKDFKMLVTHNTHVGDEFITCDIPKPILNQNFLNSMLARKDEHPLGTELLKDKSFGTVLLCAMLRDNGHGDKEVRYLDNINE